MAKQTTEDIATFLKRQEPDVLVALLLELAEQHDAVSDRLARLQLADRPDKLAAGFRKTLSAWRCSKTFYTYQESRAFGQALESWLTQIEQELLPKDPAAALALFELFIEPDASWFERADDSDGSICRILGELSIADGKACCLTPWHGWGAGKRVQRYGSSYLKSRSLCTTTSAGLNFCRRRHIPTHTSGRGNWRWRMPTRASLRNCCWCLMRRKTPKPN